MKKRFGLYAVAWAVLLALFNIIAFVSPGWIWFEKYDAAFWIGYSCISLTFIGQLICAWFALKEENATRLFYKLSLINTSYTGLILTFVIGGLCMLISPLPYWIGILVCSIVLAVNAMAVIKAATAIEEVVKIDEKVKTKTIFIKMLAVDAENLMTCAKSENIKAVCKKVYEAVHYSDPVSDNALVSVESEIARAFATFSDAVNNDSELAISISTELLGLIADRNKKCKLFK